MPQNRLAKANPSTQFQQAFHSSESDCFLYSLYVFCIVFKDRAAAFQPQRLARDNV